MTYLVAFSSLVKLKNFSAFTRHPKHQNVSNFIDTVVHFWLAKANSSITLSKKHIIHFMRLPAVLLFASTTKWAKSISYLAKPNFDCNFLTKSLRGMGVLHRSRGWQDFVYVCNHSTGRNFYPNDTKFGKLVGLVKIQVKFEDGYACGSHRSLGSTTKNLNNFLTKSLSFDLKVSLDRTYQDLKLWVQG